MNKFNASILIALIISIRIIYSTYSNRYFHEKSERFLDVSIEISEIRCPFKLHSNIHTMQTRCRFWMITGRLISNFVERPTVHHIKYTHFIWNSRGEREIALECVARTVFYYKQLKFEERIRKREKNENSFGKQASEHIILINWMSVTHMAFVYHSDTHNTIRYNTIQYIEQYGLYSIDRYAHASMFYDHQNIETGDRSSYFYWPISLRCVECVWMCVSVLFTRFCAFTLTLISYFPNHSQYLVLPWILWNCWAQKKIRAFA